MLEPDRGASARRRRAAHARLSPGPPPTSGPHRPEPVERDQTELSDDQILEALHLGNVVIAYEGDAARPTLQARSPAFDPDLAAAGQAVILARRPGIGADHRARVAAAAAARERSCASSPRRTSARRPG